MRKSGKWSEIIDVSYLCGAVWYIKLSHLSPHIYHTSVLSVQVFTHVRRSTLETVKSHSVCVVFVSDRRNNNNNNNKSKDGNEGTCVPGWTSAAGASSCAPEKKKGDPRFGCFHRGAQTQTDRERGLGRPSDRPSSSLSSPFSSSRER